MIIRMYSIHDRVADEFGQPFFGRSDEEIVRQFRYQDYGDTMYAKAPDDFSIVFLGCIDTVTGQVLLPENSTPKFIVRLSSLIHKEDDLVEHRLS